MSKKVIITGANGGIGKATAVIMATKGYHVVMVCRNIEKGEQARQEVIQKSGNQQVELMQCDFSDISSIRAFGMACREKHPVIDVLINNAGGMFKHRTETADKLEYTFALNHIGYFLTTHYLLDCLKAAGKARIVSVSSEAHRIAKLNFDDLQASKKYNQWRVYGNSKLCNILFTKQLSEKLDPQFITANCLHPGVVATNFGVEDNPIIKWASKRMPFFLTPEQGAATSIYLATAPEVEGITGVYYSKSRPKKTTGAAKNAADAQRLWDISMQICDLQEYGTV